jgi:DTW domain-containing protein YfiP
VPAPSAEPPAPPTSEPDAPRRCAACGLPAPLCVCPSLVRQAATTRVVVVMHAREVTRPSNTGRLAPLLLERAEVRIHGALGAPVRLDDLLAEPGAAVLFPDPDAAPLDPLRPPRTLVVPDGSWRQARRIARREGGLAALPRVRLSDTAPSAYQLRCHPSPDRLATFEAIAQALGVLEGPELEATLLAGFDRFVQAVLHTRGRRARSRAELEAERALRVRAPR